MGIVALNAWLCCISWQIWAYTNHQSLSFPNELLNIAQLILWAVAIHARITIPHVDLLNSLRYHGNAHQIIFKLFSAYSMAIPVVNVLWLYDCLRQGTILPTGESHLNCKKSWWVLAKDYMETRKLRCLHHHHQCRLCMPPAIIRAGQYSSIADCQICVMQMPIERILRLTWIPLKEPLPWTQACKSSQIQVWHAFCPCLIIFADLWYSSWRAALCAVDCSCYAKGEQQDNASKQTLFKTSWLSLMTFWAPIFHIGQAPASSNSIHNECMDKPSMNASKIVSMWGLCPLGRIYCLASWFFKTDKDLHLRKLRRGWWSWQCFQKWTSRSTAGRQAFWHNARWKEYAAVEICWGDAEATFWRSSSGTACQREQSWSQKDSASSWKGEWTQGRQWCFDSIKKLWWTQPPRSCNR